MKANKSGPATIDGESGKPLPVPARIPCTRLSTVREIRREMATVYRLARYGRMRTQDATRLAFILTQIVKTLEFEDLQLRLETLEAQQGL